MQLRTVKAIYEHEQIAVIDVTGGGKLHNFRLTGTFLGGVHLIFHPILALTADQLTQFQSGSDEYGAIVAINLDEIATTIAVKRKIIAFITQLKNQPPPAKCRIRLPNNGQKYKAEQFLTEKAQPRLKR